MSITNTEVVNKNFLSPVGFKFTIKKTPNINYFVQSINMPSVTLGETAFPTPFRRIPVAGDHIEYGALDVTFKVDESMQDYLEIFNWIQGMGFDTNFDQYKTVDPALAKAGSGGGVYSDATLTILSSSKNPIHQVTFSDIFPVSLSEFQFDSRMSDIEYVEATVSFKFRTFNIITL